MKKSLSFYKYHWLFLINNNFEMSLKALELMLNLWRLNSTFNLQMGKNKARIVLLSPPLLPEGGK